jgi:nucleoside-diphosphate-sugar epimerase
MRIFLTGGTGFIGSHFINEAHIRGYQVVALRRPGAFNRIQLIKQPIWIDGQLDGEFTNELSGVDALVHLASHTPNPPYDNLPKCLYWNVYASIKLAEQAKQCGVKKFLIAGSCFEYGETANNYSEIPVDAPLLPSVSYPTSKAAASVAFMGFASEHLVQLQILRLFQVFGEGEQESRFWPSLRFAALNGEDFKMSAGDQVRDFINVVDVARVIADSLDFNDVKSGSPKIKNVGSGTSQTLKQFAEYWWKKWGATGQLKLGEIPYRKNEVMRLVPKLYAAKQ